MRVLEDIKLPLDNTRSERALRKIVVGRKAWMFYGSDTHAEAAAAIFSVIASCRLHRLDPCTYLDELLRVLPYWPRERYLELSPRHWSATRARLRPEELAAPLSAFEVPAAQPAAGLHVGSAQRLLQICRRDRVHRGGPADRGLGVCLGTGRRVAGRRSGDLPLSTDTWLDRLLGGTTGHMGDKATEVSGCGQRKTIWP